MHLIVIFENIFLDKGINLMKINRIIIQSKTLSLIGFNYNFLEKITQLPTALRLSHEESILIFIKVKVIV